jgi:hypothetical protein
MQRVAKVYVESGSRLAAGIRALLDSNGIDYAEIDVSDDTPMLDWIRQRHSRAGVVPPRSRAAMGVLEDQGWKGRRMITWRLLCGPGNSRRPSA